MHLPKDFHRDYDLTDSQASVLETLLHSINYDVSLKSLWSLIDQVWDEIGCDNINPDGKQLGLFYSHPIWILNGIFSEIDETSAGHRHAMAEWIAVQGLQKIMDYGGGGGAFARILADKSKDIHVDIFEPYPNDRAVKLCNTYPNLKYINEIKEKCYDCLVAIDVMEHLVNPLPVLSQMISAVKLRGFLLLANNFYPVIKCHLPRTFHFRYSFDIFCRKLGLHRLGLCRGSHAQIYIRTRESNIDWQTLSKLEEISRYIFSGKRASALRVKVFKLIAEPTYYIQKSLLKLGTREPF